MGAFLNIFVSLFGFGCGVTLGIIAGYLYYLFPGSKMQKVSLECPPLVPFKPIDSSFALL